MATAAEILGVQNTPVELAANPQATATIPLQDPGQTVDVNSPPPSTVQPGADPATAMIQSQPNPAYQDPEIRMAAAHHNWLNSILDKATDILAGDTSVHVTRDPQGNVTVTHDPATSGEKWGRVAAAVLGGAAKGYAAGQGPGGAARAVATGFQTGQDVSQQQLAQANAEAANMNAQQLAAANNALVHQKIVGAGLANREAGLTLGTQEAGLLQSAADSIQDSPNTTDLGNFTDMQGIMKAVQNNPAILQGHTNQALKIIPTADATGKVQLHAFLVDAGDDNRKNDKVEKAFKIEVDPTTGAPTLVADDIAPQSQKKGDIRLAQQAMIAKYFDMRNKYTTSQASATTAAAAATRANAAATEAGQKAPLIQAQTSEANARAGEANANAAKTRAAIQPPGGGTPAAAGTFDPAFPPPQNFPPGTPGINPKQIGKVPAATSTKAGLARNINENTDEAVKIIQAQGDQLLGPALGRVTTVEQMIGNNNPNISALGTRIHNIAMASVGIHGSRAVGNVHDQETNLLNHFKAGKDAALAALSANRDSASTFLTEERNWNTYGSATGPIRQAATSTTPSAASQSAAGYSPGVNSAQFPIAQNAQGQKTQWNGTAWTPLP